MATANFTPTSDLFLVFRVVEELEKGENLTLSLALPWGDRPSSRERLPTSAIRLAGLVTGPINDITVALSNC